MTPGELTRLTALVRDHWDKPYRKVLACAPDVGDALAEASKEASRDDSSFLTQWGRELVSLLGIEVHVHKSWTPGLWKLTRHDACEVTGREDAHGHIVIYHGNCTVLGKEETDG